MRRTTRPRYPDLPPFFLGSAAVAAGLLTPQQLRGPLVRRLLTGAYRPRWVPETHLLRCSAAALVLEGAPFAVTGASAATILGVELRAPGDHVEVLVPESRRVSRRAGVVLRRAVEFPDDLLTAHGLPVVPPERMALDLTRGQSLAYAVARLDAVCRGGLVDREQLAAWLARRSCAGVVLARSALALVDPRAESIPESLVRVAMVRSDVVVEPQHVVRDRGRFVARVDLAVVAARVAIEYDGAWHGLREQLEDDRDRLKALREAGWVVVHVTADKLGRLGEVVDAVRRAIDDQARVLR